MKNLTRNSIILSLVVSILLNVCFIKNDLDRALLREEPKNYRTYLMYKDLVLESEGNIILIKHYEGEILGAAENLSEGLKILSEKANN